MIKKLTIKLIIFGIYALPKKIYYLSELPKTRSGKILRRLLRDILINPKSNSYSDLSTILNSQIVNEIQLLVNKNSNTNFNKIAKIIAKHTRETKSITLDTTVETIERWDSLSHIKIIVDVEKDFDLKIDTSIIGELNSVKSIIKYIETEDKA